MTATTYTFRCSACGKVVMHKDNQAYVTIAPKSGQYPSTFEICEECTRDLYDLMNGKLEQRIAEAEEEHIPVSLWGHHE